MICSNCKEYEVILDFENYIIKKNPQLYEELNSIIEQYFMESDGCQECDGCGSTIAKGEPVANSENGILNSILNIIAKEVMNTIKCCSQCGQGEDISGMYASIKSIFSDPEDDPIAIFNSINTATELGDLLSDFLGNNKDSWEPYYHELVKKIECPRCDNGGGIDWSSHIDNGEFDMYTEVYTQSDIDQFNHQFYGDALAEISFEISKIAEKFTIDELVTLKRKYVSDKLFLSRESEFAKLYELIKESAIVYLLGVNRLLFRARGNDGTPCYSTSQMWSAPSNKVSQGRYNDVGEGYLYLSNNEEVIKKEVLIQSGIYNIGVFKVKNPLVLLPVDFLFGYEYKEFISDEVAANSRDDKFKEQYIITNIVSAIAKAIGYNGIVYMSTKDKFSVNYTLFQYDKNIDLECFKTYESY